MSKRPDLREPSDAALLARARLHRCLRCDTPAVGSWTGLWCRTCTTRKRLQVAALHRPSIGQLPPDLWFKDPRLEWNREQMLDYLDQRTDT